jgi:GNAT superfamily N-acetyltransferase
MNNPEEFPHPDYEIEPVNSSQIDVLWELILELAEFGKLQTPGNFELLKDSILVKEAAEAFLIRNRVSKKDSKTDYVGFVVFFQNFSTFQALPGLYLEDLYVRPEQRGQKIGSAVMQWLAQVAKSRGYARMDWEALNWNHKALSFYKSDPILATVHEEWVHCRLEGEEIGALAEKKIF